MVRILNTIHSSTTDFSHQNRPLLVYFNDFWNFSLLKGAQKSLFLGLISLEILVFPKGNDLGRPELLFKADLRMCKISISGADFTRNYFIQQHYKSKSAVKRYEMASCIYNRPIIF